MQDIQKKIDDADKSSKEKCIGPSCNVGSQPTIVFDAALVSLFVGVGAAAVGGVWLLARTRKVKDGSS
jgi:hypothetical protein